MNENLKGPIEDFSWGKFVINGQEHGKSSAGKIGAGKDIRLIGNKVTSWQERKGHVLEKAMITGIYGQDIEVLVIGLGVYKAITCPEEVEQGVLAHGIQELILQSTPEACSTYNKFFREGKRVALLAHGTC